MRVLLGIGASCLGCGVAGATDSPQPDCPPSEDIVVKAMLPNGMVLAHVDATAEGHYLGMQEEPALNPDCEEQRTMQPDAEEKGTELVQTKASPEQGFIQGWETVSAASLDDMRGGFETAHGLKISFGIERAVYVNGDLAASATVDLSTGGQIASQKGTGADTAAVTLIQNGPGNTFQPGPLAQGAAATVIQNTLNNQSIKNLTVVNTTVNSMELLKKINLNTSLQDALHSVVLPK